MNEYLLDDMAHVAQRKWTPNIILTLIGIVMAISFMVVVHPVPVEDVSTHTKGEVSKNADN